MKREMADRAAKTRSALDALDPATRLAMEVSVCVWGGGGGWLGCCAGSMCGGRAPLPACLPAVHIAVWSP